MPKQDGKVDDPSPTLTRDESNVTKADDFASPAPTTIEPSKSPTVSLISSHSPSESLSVQVPAAAKKGQTQQGPKTTIDYSKRENNVSVNFLKIHKDKMRQWRDTTLETLIDEQDCAVEAVKLQWLLQSEIDLAKSKSKNSR